MADPTGEEVDAFFMNHPRSDDEQDEDEDPQEEEEDNADEEAGEEMADGEAGGGEAADGEDDSGLDDESRLKKRLLNIAQAKGCVSLSRKVSNTAASNPNSSARKKRRAPSSKAWEFCLAATIRPGLRDDLLKLDPIAVPLLDKSHYYVCKLCFDDETVPLHDALKSGSTTSDGPGNLNLHLKGHESIAHLFDPTIKKGSKRIRPAGKSKRTTNAAVGAASSATGSTISNPSDPAGASKAVTASTAMYPIKADADPPMHPHFVTVKESARKKIIREYHQRTFHFANQNNLAQRVICDPKNSDFRDLIDFVARNAKQILDEPIRTRHLSWYGFSNIRTDNYCDLVAGVDFLCDEIRSFHLKELKKPVPFVSVAHDIWDAKSKECLGVTIHLYSPVRKQLFRIPVGLERSVDKKAAPTAKQSLAILEGAGIGKDDIYRAANDTTNSALKTGRLMTADGDEGTCFMHITQLCIDHATGRKKRSVDKQIVDDFPECESIRLASLKASKTVWDRKSKKKWEEYTKLMASGGRKFIKPSQPNKTRASGIRIHYESMIRSRWNLDLFWYKKGMEAQGLDNAKFVILAQLWSVLYPIGGLAFEIQTDDVGALSYSFLYYFRCLVLYATKKRWWVPDVCKSHHPDDETQWDGNAKFPELGHNGDPISIPANAKTLAGTVRQIQMVALDSNDLHSVPALLVTRLCKELRSYGGEPTRDQLLAMACNPFTATTGMKELQIQGMVLQQEVSVDEETKALAKDFKELAMGELEKEARKICQKMLPTTPPPSDNEDASDLPLVEQLRLKMEREEAAKQAQQDNAKDSIQREIEDFFSQIFDPIVELPKQTRKVAPEVLARIGTTPSKWMENWPIVVKNFDVFDWWERTGKEKFPHIYHVACCILPLPDSNGHQERTFSTATWMDSKLQQRTKDMTFQQKVIIAKNRSFLHHNKVRVEEVRRDVAQRRTKELLELSAELMSEAPDLDDKTDAIDNEELRCAVAAIRETTVVEEGSI